MTAWNEIYEFLQPKKPLFCPQTPSLVQKVFLRTNVDEALYGGAAGGGKSSALLMAALQYVDVPGYSAILFRKTFADLSLPEALMDRFKDWMSDYPEVHWNNNLYVATFPSGARVTFGYLNNINDYLRYKGAEFQFVGMDEVTEIRKDDYIYLFSRLRKPPTGPLSEVPLRMRAASNPAPNWVRDRFLIEGRKEGRVFVPARFTDNPGVDHASYRNSLSKLDTVERKQLEEGDWWVSQGGSMFKREDFVVIEPIDIPTLIAPKFVRYWDKAATEPSPGNSDPDYTVGTLMMLDQGVTYILDVKRFRKRSHEAEQIMQATALEDGIHTAIRLEQEPGSAGKDVIDHFARNVFPGYDFAGIRSTGDKATRAKPYAAASANGLVKLVIDETSDWKTDFIDEHANFPENCDHDDQVDSAAGGFSALHGLGMVRKRPIQVIV
jgi:predicted phage terminase large subunit-like protein